MSVSRAKSEPLNFHPYWGSALPLRGTLRISLVTVGVFAGAVVGQSIFDTAVFNRSATRPADQANLQEPKAVSTIIVRIEPVKSPVQPTLSDQAQDLTELDELKAKIWEAEVAQRNFAAGLPHCSELSGTNFYFSQQNRLLNCKTIAAHSTIWSRRECLIDKMPTRDGHRCKNRRPPIRPTARQSRACRPSGKN